MKLLVSGLVNIETTLRVEGFPIAYSPVRYPFGGVGSTVSGVGVNLALALAALGDEVRFLSILGRDREADWAAATLAGAGVDCAGLLRDMEETARSVILYDGEGRRQINVDLKDIQERRYPRETFLRALDGTAGAALCNINFNRDLLHEAKARGLPLLTDVHTLADPADPYNADFMAAADVLFLSDEHLWAPPEEAVRELMARYAIQIVVVGMGSKGAFLLERGLRGRVVPAVITRSLVSTIGAGDALFSAFAHFWLRGHEAAAALAKAATFASWKIGKRGAAQGFLDEASLEAEHARIGAAPE
jgi:ribokinase